MDRLFRVEVISQTPNPQRAIYGGLHQDYSEAFVADGIEYWPHEKECGKIAITRLLKGGRGHFGPLEHPQIVLNCGYFPHSTMQQARTHRHISFDVQSGRYTSSRIVAAALHKISVEKAIYLRPEGEYTDRKGKKYLYNFHQRSEDLKYAALACDRYRSRLDAGHSEEHARGLLPFDVRQHWVMSMNMRSLAHFLSVRGKPDAQLECQQLCELILPHFKAWAPEIYEWFMANQWKKGRLAP